YQEKLLFIFLKPPHPKIEPFRMSRGLQLCKARTDGGSSSDKISNTILYMICKDTLPVSIVEFEGFKEWIKLLAPLYKVP
ncbi:hypothetical protein TSAR_013590, partial [Trichomalopsis sarcophagae]